MKDIFLPTGKVAGVGKIKVFATKAFDKVIPTLSFIVAEKDGLFTGTCIPLLLDCYDTSIKGVCDKLSALCEEFLTDLFNYNSEHAWEQLHDMFTSDISIEYRNAYYDVQLYLAEKGISCDSKLEEYLVKRLKEAEEELEQYRSGNSVKIKVDIVDFEKVAA